MSSSIELPVPAWEGRERTRFERKRRAILVSQFSFHQLAWYRAHRHAQRYPAALRNRPARLDAAAREVLQDTWDPAIGSWERFERRTIQKMRSRGSCHGQCMTLIQLLKENPNLSCGALRQRLKASLGAVTRYQFAEVIRAKRKQPVVCDAVFTHRESEALQEFLIGSDGAPVLVRKHSRGNIHHVLFYHSSEEERYWFYDSHYLAGFYEYDSAEDLVGAFVTHAEAVIRDHAPRRATLYLEKYEL